MVTESGSRLPECGRHAFWCARADALIVTESAEDLLVYDSRVDHLHYLNPLAAWIWKSLDGTRDLSELVAVARKRFGSEVSVSAVELALHRLAEAELLDEPIPVKTPVASSGMNRRRLVKQAAVGGVLLPTIVSVTTVSAAQTRSCVGDGGQCDDKVECCTDLRCDPATLLCQPFEQECVPQSGRCDDQHLCCDGLGLECRDSQCLLPAVTCHEAGQACKSELECCDGLICTGSMCMESQPEPTCHGTGQACKDDHECCEGLDCRDAECLPPEVICIPVNSKCDVGDVCCGDATCDGIICTGPPVPTCHEAGDVCKDDRECCDGLTCSMARICE